jgi:hypothetical protein
MWIGIKAVTERQNRPRSNQDDRRVDAAESAETVVEVAPDATDRTAGGLAFAHPLDTALLADVDDRPAATDGDDLATFRQKLTHERVDLRTRYRLFFHGPSPASSG